MRAAIFNGPDNITVGDRPEPRTRADRRDRPSDARLRLQTLFRPLEISMTDHTALAEAFSKHRFAEVTSALAGDVTWNLVGEDVIRGRDAVVALCDQSARDLAAVSTDWDTFRLIDGGRTGVVESRATYTTADGEVSRVASCDLYDIVDQTITAITSFTVAV